MSQGAEVCLLGISTLWGSLKQAGLGRKRRPHTFLCLWDRGLRDQKTGLGFALEIHPSVSFLICRVGMMVCTPQRGWEML